MEGYSFSSPLSHISNNIRHSFQSTLNNIDYKMLEANNASLTQALLFGCTSFDTKMKEAATTVLLRKTDVDRNFTKFKGKYLCQSFFFNKNFTKKETLVQVFSGEFCEISNNTFFTEHLWTAATKINTVILNTSIKNYIRTILRTIFFLNATIFYHGV